MKRKKRLGANILSIDFDYFFPVKECVDPEATLGEWSMYDWGHSENLFQKIMPMLWQSRAAGFLLKGEPLPFAACDPFTFLRRFNVRMGAPLYVSDSHSGIVPAIFDWDEPIASVWNFDAHHDAGYHGNEPITNPITCENWAIPFYNAGATIHVRYPRWRPYAMTGGEPTPPIPVDRSMDNGCPVPVIFDAVFICRSGSWVPPWCDISFLEFLHEAERLYGSAQQIQNVDMRPFDLNEAKRHAEITKKLMTSMA